MKYSTKDKAIIVAGTVFVLAVLVVSLSPRPLGTPQEGSLNAIKGLNFAELAFAGAAQAQDLGYIYTQEKDTLSVTGESTINTNPDEVHLSIGVVTESTSAKESQQENARIMQGVRSAIASKGVPNDRISTSQFSVYPITRYDDNRNVVETIGYRTSHILLVKLSDIAKAGEAIDAAADAGANEIGNIRFTLSESRQKELRSQALREAALNAKEKANTIASTLDVRLVKPTHISEGFVSVLPFQRSFELAETQSAGAPTDILPGDVSVSATLSVVYEIE